MASPCADFPVADFHLNGNESLKAPDLPAWVLQHPPEHVFRSPCRVIQPQPRGRNSGIHQMYTLRISENVAYRDARSPRGLAHRIALRAELSWTSYLFFSDSRWR